VNTSSLTLALALLAGLAGCGGGGGGEPASNDPPSTGTKTPMDSLVVPDAMTWSTTQKQGLQLQVLGQSSGLPVADAAVSLFSFNRLGPNSADALAEPVPQDLIDSGMSAADGSVTLAARLPAHLSEVLVVVSAGAASVSQVVQASQLGQPLTLRLTGF